MTFTFLSADVGKTIDLVAFTDCNQTNFRCQLWLHSLYIWWFWWFSQLFHWILRLKWSIWSRWARETKQEQNKQQLFASLRHADTIRSRMKAEQEKSFSTAALSIQKRNDPVVIIVVSTHSLGFELLVCFWCDWAFMVLLADQRRKRSCLARASTCFWTQCTEYLQQVTQSAQFHFQPVLNTGDFIFHQY